MTAIAAAGKSPGMSGRMPKSAWMPPADPPKTMTFLTNQTRAAPARVPWGKAPIGSGPMKSMRTMRLWGIHPVGRNRINVLNVLKPKPMNKITILLADDHNIIRHGLRALLKLEKDFEVVGEAVTG